MPRFSIFQEAKQLSKILNLNFSSVLMLWVFIFFLVLKKIIKTPVPAIRIRGSYNGSPFCFELRDRMDLAVLKEIFINKEYVFPFTVTPKIILDIGANIGTTSLFLAHTYPEATIYAVEADPDIYKRLLINTAPYKNVHCFNLAMSNTDGTMTFNKGGSHLGGSIKERTSTVSSVTIPAKKLSTLLKEQNIPNIDLLKIDIEGAEEEVFTDLQVHPEVMVSAVAAELHYDLADKTTLDTFKQGFKNSSIKPLGTNRELFYGSKA